MSDDKVLHKCNVCRSAEELNSEDIPFWSKKKENYSPYPTMISCGEEAYSLHNSDLKEIEPELNENSLELKLTLGEDKKHKFVFYWAPNQQENIHEINPPETAYGDYENHGLKKCNDEGEVLLKLNCPQPYKDDTQTYCRHVHYIVEDSEKTWLPLQAVRIMCAIPIEYLDERIRAGDCMIINSLSAKDFKKDKIPKSVNLTAKSLDKLTTPSKERRIMEFLKRNIKEYPILHDLVLSKTLDIKDIPIITYCANLQCDASKQLLDYLYECKINNTLEWKEGIEGWNKVRSKKDIILFEDAKEKEESDVDTEEESEDKSGEEESEDESGEEESTSDSEEESEDDDFVEIIHEGVEYYIYGDTLYDSYLDRIGKVEVVDGKIITMDKKSQQYHDKMKKTEPLSTTKPKDSKDSVDKDSKKETSGEYTRDSLDHKNKGDLKDIVKSLAARDTNTYEYEAIKDMPKSELVKVVSICQGKKFKVSTKTDYKFPSDSQLNKMGDEELRELVNEMTGREPGTYKYTESSWSKPKLIDFILTCQGIPKPRKKGGSYFVGGGWSI